MAETNRSPIARGLEFLLKEPWRASFYAALLAVERLFKSAPPIGSEGPAGKERVRLRPSVSLAFPAADLEQIEEIPKDERLRITTTFLGLYGVDSPLPTAYPERLARMYYDARGIRVRAFLDIFHHRILSMLYRAWKKYRPVSHVATSPDDPIYRRLLSLVGYESQLGLGGSIMPSLWEARLLILRPPTAVGLEAALRRKAGYRIDVEQMIQRWVAIPPDQRSRLGAANCELGSTLVAGARVLDCNRVRLHINARDFEMFLRLLPEGPDRRRIEETARRYLRDPVEFDTRVVIPTKCIIPLSLGDRKSRVGLCTWLGRPRGDYYNWTSKPEPTW
jgi:type VI secretion system protein ImpH